METGGLFEMMDDRIISIPEAMKNKVMGNVRLVDWFQWWMMDDRYTPYPCKRLWRTRLCASGLFWMMDDKYAPYPCQRLQRTVMVADWFRWWMMISTHLIHARGCKEQGHGKLETVGLFLMMDDSYASHPCQRLQRPKSWETGDCWIILDEGYEEQGHGELEAGGCMVYWFGWWIMDDRYAPYPCQRPWWGRRQGTGGHEVWLRMAGCCTAECPHTQTSPCGNRSPVNRQSILPGIVSVDMWPTRNPFQGDMFILEGANIYFCNLCCISLSQSYPLHLPLLNI